MIYYEVNGYIHTHYGAARSFANRIGAKVRIKKTYNPFKIVYAAMN